MLEEAFFALAEAWGRDRETWETDREARRKELTYSLTRRVIRLELVFCPSAAGQVKNTLYARIYPNKNEGVYYLLPELFTELDIPEFRSCFFSGIESELRLERCFGQLTELLDLHLGEIELAAEEGRIPLTREEVKPDTLEHRLIFGNFPEARDRLLIVRFSRVTAHKALLTGNRKKAVRLLERLRARGKSLAYEDRLCAFLKTCGDGFEPMPEACNTVQEIERLKKRSAVVLLGGFGLLLAAFSVLFFLGQLAFQALFRRDAVAVFAPERWTALLLAGLPALFGVLALRRPLISLLSPRQSQTMKRFDKLENSRANNILACLAFAASVIYGLVMLVLLNGWTIRLYPDRFDAASRDSIFHRETYSYAEIQEICHVEARYNSSGDRIERSSYLILMQDGRRCDFDGNATEKQCETVLFPLLEPYEIPLTELDSPRDLD